jgi:hypothetical protein
MDFFDEVGQDRPDKLNIKPFHAINKQDEKAILDWCKQVIEGLEKQAISRNSKLRKNLEAYRGSQHETN